MPICIHELEGKISHHPEERREEAGEIIGVLFFFGLGLEMDVFCQVDDQTQILDGTFINGARGVVDEAARGEDGKGEDLGVVGAIFVHSPDSFSVNDDDVDRLTISGLPLERSAPDPQPFGAGVDGGAHSEAIGSVQEHSIEEIGLARAVEPSHGNNADRALEGAQEVYSFILKDVFARGVDRDERDRLLLVHSNFKL